MLLTGEEYRLLKKRVWLIVQAVRTSEYDRCEDVINGFYVRAWRKRVNGKTTYHFGYRLEWQSSYAEIHPSRLIEWIVKS